MRSTGLIVGLFLALTRGAVVVAAGPPPVAFRTQQDAVQIDIGTKPFARYVFADKDILRPYFSHVHAPHGQQVTRNQPPVKGKDLDDHPTFHPGIWLAFGDLDGADFWRNRARVRNVEFIERPRGGPGNGTFVVRNAYQSADRTICDETCRISIRVVPSGYLLIWTSVFVSAKADFYFGDQEEMGLGLRLTTPLAVVKGGEIANSNGLKNEAQVWGKTADWCAYSGVLEGERLGMLLVSDPLNFRPAWFHARNYGLVVANPFGRNAFTKGEKSKVIVKKGETFRLRFGILVYDSPMDRPVDLNDGYRQCLKEFNTEETD